MAPVRAVRSVDDSTFDDLLPIGLQVKADAHFTPAAVARRAACLLSPSPGLSVLDVGAGAGKFCLMAALAAPATRFTGVEWRPHLVRFATQLARDWDVPNVRFEHANAFDLDWASYDAFYFYNPFAEQWYEPAFLLDHTLDLDPKNFGAFIDATRMRLAAAALGTRLVTYHGFGGDPPDGYDLVLDEPAGTDRIELWVKARASEATS